MKAPLFNVGQAVTLAFKPYSYEILHGPDQPGRPMFGEVYHVSLMGTYEPLDTVVIALAEFSQTAYFEQEAFCPVMPSEALAELLEEVFTPVHD